MSRKYLVVYTDRDEASLNLYRALEEVMYSLEASIDIEYLKIDDHPIYADHVDEVIGVRPSLVIFLSRHSAKSDTPTISAHTPGNPGDQNLYGGLPRSLPMASPCFIGGFIRRAYQNVAVSGLDYVVTLEVTHHGPTELSAPAAFVEIGPRQRNWNDSSAAYVVAKSLVETFESLDDQTCIRAVGFGGPHYAPIFTSMILKSNYGFGHIISKYVLESCDENIIEMAVERNGGVDVAVVNWKGLKGGVRQCVYSKLQEMGLETLRV